MKLITISFLTFLFVSSVYAGSISGPARVVDGDGLEINGEEIRLFGIDAAEAGQKCNKKGGGKWACGKVAITFLKSLIGNNTVKCTYNNRGDYGRALGECKAGSKQLNSSMVVNGHAWAFRKYSTRYIKQEEQAKASNKGIWQAPTQTPWEYRASKWKVAVQKSPQGCPIKGNINRKKERIYHAPWSPWYKRTKVSLKKGERWFCSEDEAIKAGWRPPDWG